MKEEKKEINVEEEKTEKKDGFFKRAGKAVGKTAKKVWPWVVGGVLIVGGGILYLMFAGGDPDALENAPDAPEEDVPFEATGEVVE